MFWKRPGLSENSDFCQYKKEEYPMRNLKRALSLALASVMLLGMMVVGSSAKGIDDFTDKAEIVNQDAVAVTSAIGMFEGYEDGSFGPENVVTRAEMAVIICTMLYGAGVNVNQFAETNVFTDVPAWAEGYVNLCSSLGIVAGVGDGKFDPNATVTTAQAVLMLCRALGYFQNAADFGDNWMLAATAKGTALGLYGDLKLTANAGLTRDNVAELVFNALTKAVPVQYNELLGVYYNENQGIIYSLEFNYLQTLGYKNFDLSVFINGSYGNKVMNYISMKLTHMNTAWSNQLDAVNGRANLVPIDPDKVYADGSQWYYDVTNVKVANSDTYIPRASINDPNDNDRVSDRYVEDGSYIRLKNISLGYTFPKAWIKKLGLENLRLYGNIQNLLTITKYDGYDPEIGASTADAQGYTYGVDNGRYPSPTVYSFGMNITF